MLCVLFVFPFSLRDLKMDNHLLMECVNLNDRPDDNNSASKSY